MASEWTGVLDPIELLREITALRHALVVQEREVEAIRAQCDEDIRTAWKIHPRVVSEVGRMDRKLHVEATLDRTLEWQREGRVEDCLRGWVYLTCEKLIRGLRGDGDRGDSGSDRPEESSGEYRTDVVILRSADGLERRMRVPSWLGDEIVTPLARSSRTTMTRRYRHYGRIERGMPVYEEEIDPCP